MTAKKQPSANTGEWKSGSAYEFLGLTPEESSYVDLKLRLSKALKLYRLSRPLSQQALARKLRSSQSRVAKMERGDPNVTIDLLLRGLIVLGVTRAEIAKVLVFDEPKPLAIKPDSIASTAATKPSFAWYHFPGKSYHGNIPLKQAESGDSSITVLNVILKRGELAYG